MNTALFLTCFVNSDETLSTFHKEGHNQQTFKIMNILRTNTRIKDLWFLFRFIIKGLLVDGKPPMNIARLLNKHKQCGFQIGDVYNNFTFMKFF